MRIVSSFKDYYDIGLTYGIDPKCVYVRETRELENPRPDHNKAPTSDQLALIPLLIKGNSVPYDGGSGIDGGIVAFCGHVYPFWSHGEIVAFSLPKLADLVNKDPTVPLEDKKRIVSVVQFVLDPKIRHTIRHSGRFYAYGISHYSFKKWQQEFKPEIEDEVFRYFNTPIMLVEHNSNHQPKVTINPRLNKLGFASVIDPYKAFQELSMYIGNNLVNQKDPNPPISDILKAETHGFNKWSFRKPPTH